MANLTTSTQSTETVAPQWYTNYAQNQANAVNAGVNNANYVGATPLQQQAFSDVNSAASQYLPTLAAAGNTLNAATSSTAPLSAASPYFTAAGQSPAEAASGYVSNYLMPAAQGLSDINQNNINNNLAPMANAGAIGSGQYGSTRNASVLGQTEALANQGVNNTIANMLNTGYQSALSTAEQQNALESQKGSAAANAAAQGQQNLTQAGQAQSQLAAQNQNLGLTGVNALATLGGQEQQILQNQQLFDLTKAKAASDAMAGIQVPTTTNTTLNASPLSSLAALGAGGAGLAQLGGGLSNLVTSGIGSLSSLIPPPLTDATGNSYGSASNANVQNQSGQMPSANLPTTQSDYGNPLTSDVITNTSPAYDANGIPVTNDNWGEAP